LRAITKSNNNNILYDKYILFRPIVYNIAKIKIYNVNNIKEDISMTTCTTNTTGSGSGSGSGSTTQSLIKGKNSTKPKYVCKLLDNKSSILAQNAASGMSAKMQYSQKLQISKQRGTRFWGVIELNEFGSYRGAPGGAGAAPKNNF
jgi:hypothetical protein